jgi:hypothetical protein
VGLAAGGSIPKVLAVIMFIGHDEEAKARSTLPTKGNLSTGGIVNYGSKLSLRTLQNSARPGLTNPMMVDIEKELGISR